jgi:hypothetical protein
MNTIVITGYRRPELFKIQCNQLLKEKEEFDKYKLHLFLDYGFHPDYYKVISWLKTLHRNIKLTIRTEEESKKSPLPAFYNIMDSYRAAVEESDEFVIVMEEDMIVTQDYLRFNRVCYELFLSKYSRIFCVCHKRRPEIELKGNINILIGDYQLTSPSCVSVKVIKELMIPTMSNPLFFANPIYYNQMFFTTSKNKPDVHIHHDGQIERIAEINNMFSIKPDQTRSMHVGVGGQHSGSKYTIDGSLNDKVAKYYELMSLGTEELRKYAENFKEDIVVTNLDNETWDNLILDPTRTLSKASSWHYDEDNEFERYIDEKNNKRL